MSNYVIVTDSTADLTKELRTTYDIDYVQMLINLEGKELPASLDWDVYSAKELYDWLRDGRSIKTSQVPYNTYYSCFEKYLKKGQDVLYIACSSALSGSYNLAKTISEELMEKYPENKVVAVDTLTSCMGQGILCIQAAINRENGYSISKNKKWLLENRKCANQICSIDTLAFLAKAGRVSASKAFFGNLFGVKPILISDAKGTNYAFTKVKGRMKSLDYIVQYTKDTIIDSENQIIYIVHGDDLEAAQYLEKKIQETIPCKGTYINYLGPIIGTSCGPGTVAIYYMGKEVTVAGE